MATLQYLLDRNRLLIADSSLSPQLYDYQQLFSSDHQTLYDSPLRADASKLCDSYLSSDISILLTNTFDANRFKLRLLGREAMTACINERAAQLTRAAIRGYERHIAVAGNIGPIGRMVPHADAVNCYAEQAEALARGGVDCFWLEAFTSRERAEAAIIGCEIGAPHLPLVVTLSFMEGKRLPVDILPISDTRAICARPNVAAIGVDTGAGELDVLRTAQQVATGCSETTLAIKMDLNALSAEIDTSAEISESASISAYTSAARTAIDAGARIIAAGRDATPSHLRAIAAAARSKYARRTSNYKSSKISPKI